MMESDIEDLNRRNRMLEARLVAVERVAHEPFDFSGLIGRLEALETLTRTQQAEIASLKRSRDGFAF